MSGFKPERGSDEWHGFDSDYFSTPWYLKKRYIAPLGATLLLATCVILDPGSPSDASEAGWTHSVSSTGMDTAEKAMSFEDCNDRIRAMAGESGTAPSNIVETRAMRIVRFPATDGSVLVTCDAIDDKIIVVKSPYS